MKAHTLLAPLFFISTAAVGQSQIAKRMTAAYDENNYMGVVTVGNKIINYLSAEDEKVVDDVMGRSYYSLQMYDSAVYFTNKAIALDNDATSTSAWAYAFRGMALYRQGKKEEGTHDLQKAVQLNKTHNSVEVAKAFLSNIYTNSVPDDSCAFYFSQKEYKNAIEEGKRQLQHKDYKTVMELVGAAYVNTHQYDSAIYFERKAVATDSDATMVSGWGHYYLGLALYNKNEKELAVQELRKTIDLNKTTHSVSKAEDFLDGIINGRSLGIDSLHQVIKDQLNNDDCRGAATTARAFLADHPDDIIAWDQLTTAYCELHSYDSSITCGQKTIALDNEQSLASCEAHYHMGIDRYMKNEPESAEREFAAATNERTSDNLRKNIARTRKFMGFTDTYDHWKTEKTNHFIFHFEHKKSIDNAEEFMAKYEQEYVRASKIFPKPLPKKIDLFVWERGDLARNSFQSSKDVTLTRPVFCLAHVSQDNKDISEILKIISYWQKSK